MAEKEYVNIQQFAIRWSVNPSKVRKALEERIIFAARRTQGGSWICWSQYKQAFKRWCNEAVLAPKERWTPGKMLDLEAMDEEQLKKFTKLDKVEQESAPPEPDPIREDMTLEELEKLLKGNISIDMAKRVRQILAGLREVRAMREADGLLVSTDELIAVLVPLGTLIKKSLRSIRPRVATQFAAMTDHHAIGRMLDKEIEVTINQYNRAMEKLMEKVGGK